MAKKIKLDFSKVEERSGINTRHIPEGLHGMKVQSVVVGEAKDGTDMLTYFLVPKASKYKTRVFPYYCKLQANQLWKLRDLFVAVGLTVPKKATMLDPDAPVGKDLAAEVEDDSYEGQLRSQVQGTYPVDILEDGEGGDDSDEPDDEEAEDEDESDEVDEDEEEEGEEEPELDTLTLAELRKIAKDLGITTAGLKKDGLIEAIEEAEAEDDEEDEDTEDEDLDDEDLYDDEDEEEEELEEEEEEEEEAPAPRKRAAKAAPAKKAAPKATAKRVVKRR